PNQCTGPRKGSRKIGREQVRNISTPGVRVNPGPPGSLEAGASTDEGEPAANRHTHLPCRRQGMTKRIHDESAPVSALAFPGELEHQGTAPCPTGPDPPTGTTARRASTAPWSTPNRPS